MANNALAFVTGLGTGYLSAKEKQKDRARQDKLDAQSQELHDARMYELNKGKKREEALAQAYQETTVNDGAVTLDVSGKPVLYEDAGVAGSDFRQARMMQERTQAAPVAAEGMPLQGAPAAAAPMVPAVQAAPVAAVIAPPKPTFAAAGLPFDDRASAQKAADTHNTTEAGNLRAAKALRAMGDPAAAAALEASSRQGKLADIQLTKAEKEQVHDAAFREVTESFVRQGWNALPKIYENYNDGNTAQVQEDGKGGALVTVFNDKGEQVGQKSFKDEMSFITDAVAKLDPKVWVTMKAAQVKDDRAQGNWDKTHALAVDGKTESRRHNMAMEGLAGQRIAKAGAGGSGRAGTGAAGEAGTVDFNPLGNFDAKKAQDVAFTQASKVADARAAEGKPMSAKEQGKLAQDTYRAMEDAFAGENRNRHVAATVATSLRAASADPTQYAETFAKAKKLGMDDATLSGMGFKAPVGDTPASAAVKPSAAEKRTGKETTVPNPVANTPPAAAAGLPAPKPAPTQASNITKALGASGGSAIDKIVSAQVPAIEAAASTMQTAKAQLKAVARSGDPQALQVAASKVTAAKAEIDAIVKDMNKPQADAVRQAAGYYQ